MTIVIRSQQQFMDDSSGTQAAWTLGGTTAVGDLAVVIHGDDYYTAAALTSPGGTAVTTWTPQYTFDGGGSLGHVKAWTGPVTTGGASTVTTTSTNTDEERVAGVWILYDTGNTVSYDTALGQAVASGLSAAAPSVTPAANNNDLLICLWMIGGGGGNNTTYTVPGTMTPYTQLNTGAGGSAIFAYQFLSSSAPTGTMTATLTPAQPNTTLSLLLQTSAAGGGTIPAGLATAAGTAPNSGTAPHSVVAGPAYVSVATDLGGGQGSWITPQYAEGGP